VIEVRRCRSREELRRSLVIWHYFGAEPSEEDAERFGSLIGEDRMLAAWDGDEIVGGAGAFPFELSLPGGRRVAAAGVTVVGVLPTHRRRGVLTELMRKQLENLRERGEPVAYLWASEGKIYSRFGYGLASLQGEIELAREHTAFARFFDPEGELRLVSPEEALAAFPAVYDRVLAERPGMFARSRQWWETRVLADTSVRRPAGVGQLERVLLELRGQPVAYATYRVQQSFETFTSTGAVHGVEVLGATPAATRAIWRWLLDMDWTSKIKADKLPVDHPLFHLLAEPRRMRFTVTDCLWVRLVDVGEALSARGYAAEGAVVFDVKDVFCPWNEDRWRLAGGRAERTEDAAELALDVTALGAAYLGGFSFRQLADALRVEELVAGAIERADTLFRTDRAPWCPEIF
jgi:predicted acetyltransferase